MTEILFLCVVNKRNIENVLSNDVIDSIKKQKCIINLLENLNVTTIEAIKKHNRLVNENLIFKKKLNENGYKEFINNKVIYSIPKKNIKEIQEKIQHERELKIKEFKEKHKYNHKQPIYNPFVEKKTEELLAENKELIIKLYTSNEYNLSELYKVFERYKIVQKMLSNRNVEYNTFKLRPYTAQTIITLLGNKCSECNSKSKLSLHHINQNEGEKKNDILSFQLLCEKCHKQKHYPFTNLYLYVKKD